jgi:hypothetical protein
VPQSEAPELFRVGVIPSGAAFQAEGGVSQPRSQREGDPTAGDERYPKFKLSHYRRESRPAQFTGSSAYSLVPSPLTANDPDRVSQPGHLTEVVANCFGRQIDGPLSI